MAEWLSLVAAVIAIVTFVGALGRWVYQQRATFLHNGHQLKKNLVTVVEASKRRLQKLRYRFSIQILRWRKQVKINAAQIIVQDKHFKRQGMSEASRIGMAAINLHQVWIPSNYAPGSDLQIDLIFQGQQQMGETEFRKLCVRVATWMIESESKLHETPDAELRTLKIPWNKNFAEWASKLYGDDDDLEDLPW